MLHFETPDVFNRELLKFLKSTPPGAESERRSNANAMTDDPLIRDVSDTARWMAVYRARETERDDAVFRDPFARALAGERGERIANALKFGDENAWSFIARTYLFDRFVTRLVLHGADTIVNLAAGLDTRPYRMTLPPSLRWVEVDLPDILDYKEEILGDAKPVCELERVRLDLSNEDGRRGLFADLGRRAPAGGGDL